MNRAHRKEKANLEWCRDSIHRTRKGIVINGVDESAFYTKNNTLFEKVLNFELWFFAFRFAFLALILYAKRYDNSSLITIFKRRRKKC